MLLFLDPEYRFIRGFIRAEARKTPPGSRVLDAGAGRRPYREYFAHCQYESCDYTVTMGEGRRHHDFWCDIASVPRRDNYYDVIVNTQVLEHVQRPWEVIRECCRILKPGGRLLLTVPQSSPIHEAPYHYFNFTKYGLELLFRDAGLETESIKAKGGSFLYLSKALSLMPNAVLKQYVLPKPNVLALMILAPFWGLSKLLIDYVIVPLSYLLDPLDKNRDETIGYLCVARKPDHAGRPEG
jgi:SAM-dependent methyltransferase